MILVCKASSTYFSLNSAMVLLNTLKTKIISDEKCDHKFITQKTSSIPQSPTTYKYKVCMIIITCDYDNYKH